MQPLNSPLAQRFTFFIIKFAAAVTHKLSMDHSTSNLLISLKTEPMNANQYIKSKGISLAIQNFKNYLNRSCEQRVMALFVEAVHGLRKWKLMHEFFFLCLLYSL